MIGLGYRKIRYKIRWLSRLFGVFCGFFAYEYLSANPHPEVLGAADPYLGAFVGYILGTWLVVFAFIWVIKTLMEVFGLLLGRR